MYKYYMTCSLFQIWNSAMWSTFMVLGNNHYHPVEKHFHHPKNNHYTHEAVIPNSAPRPPAPGNYFFISIISIWLFLYFYFFLENH